MQDDLLPPQADIDWAKSQLPILGGRMAAWRQECSHTLLEDLDSQPGQKFIRVRDVKPMPLIINAEVGAIINSIRSSLDVLAVTLAERNGAVAPKDIYFPICRSSGQFSAKKNGGHKKIHRLSNADKTTKPSFSTASQSFQRCVSSRTLRSRSSSCSTAESPPIGKALDAPEGTRAVSLIFI